MWRPWPRGECNRNNDKCDKSYNRYIQNLDPTQRDHIATVAYPDFPIYDEGKKAQILSKIQSFPKIAKLYGFRSIFTSLHCLLKNKPIITTLMALETGHY